MVDRIPIPDWLIPWACGFGIWMAGAYLMAPTLTQRSIDRHIAAECNRGASPAVCECVLEDIQMNSLENAFFIASFGYSDTRSRQAAFGGSDNSYVQYIAREALERKRRDDCDDTRTSSGLVMSPEQEAASERNQQRIEEALAEQRRIAEETAAETQRLAEEAQQRAADEAQRVIEAAEQAAVDALNCELGDSVLVDDAERKCRLTKEVNEEMMSWGELAAEKSRQIRWSLRRRWGL